MILEEDRRLGGGRRGENRESLGKKLADVASGAPAPKPAAAETAKAADFERGFKSKDGKDAVETAGRLRELKEEKGIGNLAKAVFRKAAGTRFYLYRDLWVDERFGAEDKTLEVKFGSEAYFKLIEREPALIEALKLGSSIVYVTAKGRALVVGGTGLETVTDAQITELFSALK